MLGSNQRQSACKTGALPTELITYMVGSLGLAPSGSKTRVLQTRPLLVTVYLPEISSIVIFKGY